MGNSDFRMLNGSSFGDFDPDPNPRWGPQLIIPDITIFPGGTAAGAVPNLIRAFPDGPAPLPDVEKDVLRQRINELTNARNLDASRLRQLEATIRVLEADKKKLEDEIARRNKPRLGEPRTVEE